MLPNTYGGNLQYLLTGGRIDKVIDLNEDTVCIIVYNNAHKCTLMLDKHSIEAA